MLSFVLANSPLKLDWVPNYSDYYPEAPGGRAAGRSVEPKPFDAKKLGDELPNLEPPYGKVPLNVVVRQQELRPAQSAQAPPARSAAQPAGGGAYLLGSGHR